MGSEVSEWRGHGFVLSLLSSSFHVSARNVAPPLRDSMQPSLTCTNIYGTKYVLHIYLISCLLGCKLHGGRDLTLYTTVPPASTKIFGIQWAHKNLFFFFLLRNGKTDSVASWTSLQLIRHPQKMLDHVVFKMPTSSKLSYVLRGPKKTSWITWLS